MARKILQDMVIKKRLVVPAPAPKIFQKEPPKEPPQIKTIKKSLFFKKLFWFFVVIFVVLIAGYILTNFSSITIKLTPIEKIITIDDVFNANRSAVNVNGVDFEIIQMQKTESTLFTATGLLTGGQKAGGTVILYNTYSSKGQYLLIETRLETPDGKIYKTTKAVTVPGNGSVEVKVVADKAGPEYNTGLTDFYIVGFKGTSKYDKIYGRSKIPITGGTSGDTVAASQEDINKIKIQTENTLQSYFFDQMNKQKPDEYLLYKNAIKTDFIGDISNPVVGTAGSQFNFKITASSTGFLINKNDLTKVLVKKYLPEENADNIYISNLNDLDFALVSSNSGNTQISFKLKGNVNFAWKINNDLVAQDLMSLPGNDYKSVFKNYLNIERAEIIFFPSWWRYLPNDKSRIHFEIAL